MKINELWLGVFGLLSIFIFIEGLHMIEHEHCRTHMSQQSSAQPAFVTSYSPEPEPVKDTLPSDVQPPGVDEEEIDYNSLEEALAGE